jgi:hypothetical protein
MSKTSKELEVRDLREEMITDDYSGPLYIPDEYKREGYHRHVADSSRGGWIQQLMRMGYTIVHDEELKASLGGNQSHNPKSIDTAVRVHISSAHKEAMGILMEIPEEKYRLRKEREAQIAQEQNNAIMRNTGIPTQTGEIIIGK